MSLFSRAYLVALLERAGPATLDDLQFVAFLSGSELDRREARLDLGVLCAERVVTRSRRPERCRQCGSQTIGNTVYELRRARDWQT